MATCNNVTVIYDSECVGESLSKINTNFANLDTGLCELGQSLLSLDAFLKSLSAKDSPTIDMSFSVAGYFLSADVINGSLGTIKLGQDIPQTTKVFLTAAKISSLLDTSISSPVSGQFLLWNGSKWQNQTVVDNPGARVLEDLEDIQWRGNKVNGQILKYDLNNDVWYNGVDETELRVRDGDYLDINVTGGGRLWDIKPGVVGSLELAKDSIITEKIKDGAVTNEKIKDGTIQLSKCAFSVGEINTGLNIGEGQGIYVGQNDAQGRLPFKSLVGGGDVTITEQNNTIIISVPPPPVIPPPPPQPPDVYYNVTFNDPASSIGINLGNGYSIYNASQSSPNNFRFKTLRGTNITIQDQGDTLEFSIPAPRLALSLLGPLTNSQVVTLLNDLFPPANFNGAICRVEINNISLSNTPTYNVTVPLTIIYERTGTAFDMKKPPRINKVGNVYTNAETLTGQAVPTSQFNLIFTKTGPTQYTCNGTTWS